MGPNFKKKKKKKKRFNSTKILLKKSQKSINCMVRAGPWVGDVKKCTTKKNQDQYFQSCKSI